MDLRTSSPCTLYTHDKREMPDISISKLLYFISPWLLELKAIFKPKDLFQFETTKSEFYPSDTQQVRIQFADTKY